MIKRLREGSRHRLRRWASRYGRRTLFIGAGVVAASFVAVQALYPSDKLLPFSSVETITTSGVTKQKAIERLNEDYANLTAAVYFESAEDSTAESTLIDMGIVVDNTKRVQELSYPWYLRIIPTSIFWAGAIMQPGPPSYQRDDNILADYIARYFGADCTVAAKDASLEVRGDSLSAVRAVTGGTCDILSLRQTLRQATPTLSDHSIFIDGPATPPAVSNAEAEALADAIAGGVQNGIVLKADGVEESIAVNEILSWMEFEVVDGELTYALNGERAAGYFNQSIAARVAKVPGVTAITTLDFTEVSRVDNSGLELDVAATTEAIKTAIDTLSGQADIVTATIPPIGFTYTRTYSASDKSLEALMKDFADSHPGTYGVSMAELTGAKRHASYNGDTKFTTASTYKLFVAYSTLLRIESGEWQWADYVHGGRDVSECFDDMISLSDNECAVTLLLRAGQANVTGEANAIGATSTSFLGNNGIKSTTNDQVLLLGMLQSGQVLTDQANRDKWISAMKASVYRQGITKGIPGATVANKVGFLYALLHDSAIVYSPTGVYILSIYTNQSSWANIAELAGEIEAWRAQ